MLFAGCSLSFSVDVSFSAGLLQEFSCRMSLCIGYVILVAAFGVPSEFQAWLVHNGAHQDVIVDWIIPLPTLALWMFNHFLPFFIIFRQVPWFLFFSLTGAGLIWINWAFRAHVASGRGVDIGVRKGGPLSWKPLESVGNRKGNSSSKSIFIHFPKVLKGKMTDSQTNLAGLI